jgi:hypothetical protein
MREKRRKENGGHANFNARARQQTLEIEQGPMLYSQFSAFF